MIRKPNYKRNSHYYQTQSPASRLKKRASLLKQSCRELVTHLKVVYLATPIDQFHDPNYSKVRDLIATHFNTREWAIFEPARCNWTTPIWLKTWPRLLLFIDALVVWPRADGSVGFGVYKEACDIQRIGKPVYVLAADARLKIFNSFSIYKERNPIRYARVRAGKLIGMGKLPEGGK